MRREGSGRMGGYVLVDLGAWVGIIGGWKGCWGGGKMVREGMVDCGLGAMGRDIRSGVRGGGGMY